MNRSIIGGLALAAGVAVSLGLGVREGIARSPGDAPVIPAVQPLTFQEAVARAHPGKQQAAESRSVSSAAKRPYCSSQSHCQSICDAMYPGQETEGFCSSGNTCYCYGALRSAAARRQIAFR